MGRHKKNHVTIAILSVLVVSFFFFERSVLYGHVWDDVVDSIRSPMDDDKDRKDVVLALLNDPQPRVNFGRYAHRPPHNVEDQSGNAFALLLCTRESSLRDPYFAATQNIAYRLLWQFRTKHRVIVFVCPWTPRSQRKILAGQGVLIRELPEFPVNVDLFVDRWRDQFTKLHMWASTDYKKIAFLDSDAFPMNNVDDVFDLVKEQQCRRSPIDPTAEVPIEAICNYTFAAVDPYNSLELNGGFLVFSPSEGVHAAMVRDAQRTNEYDTSRMEQGFLNSNFAFAGNGSRPAQYLPNEWNALSYGGTALLGLPLDKVRIVHEKLWTEFVLGDLTILLGIWDRSWMQQCRFYDSLYFREARTTGYYKTDLERYVEITRDREQTAVAKTVDFMPASHE